MLQGYAHQETVMASARTSFSRQATRLIALAAFAAAAAMPALATADIFDYQGAEWCAECHQENYNDWLASGHRQMLMPGAQARNRPLPLPPGLSWDDVSYVIGGHGWKARYLGTDGYLITRSIDLGNGEVQAGKNQYNLRTGEFVDYHAGEDKPYDCGACHTTGWVPDEDAATDGDLSDNQDGLPGIHGTFEFAGVQCEACHGPGYLMEVREPAYFCGECHSRQPTNTIQASNGFIRHQQQYNEFRASPHAMQTCVTCHDPHKASEFSIRLACEDCHTQQAESYAQTTMAAGGVECTDCHMPSAGLSAAAPGPYEGDVQTHIFRISTDPERQDMFTEDGTLVQLDPRGKAALNVEFACKRCHGAQSMDWLLSNAQNFHDPAFRVNSSLSGTWWSGPEREGEGWMLDAAGNAFVAAMYTYDANGQQAWLLGVGQPQGDVVSVDVQITEGPVTGSAYDPKDMVRDAWGTANFLFVSCTEGTVELLPNEDMLARGFEPITVNLQRLTVPAKSCMR
jgi:hypothetical protein